MINIPRFEGEPKDGEITYCRCCEKDIYEAEAIYIDGMPYCEKCAEEDCE